MSDSGESDSRVWVNPETGGVESTLEWQRRLNAGDPEAHRQLAALCAQQACDEEGDTLMPPMCVSPALAAAATAAGLDLELARLDLELGLFRRRFPQLAAEFQERLR